MAVEARVRVGGRGGEGHGKGEKKKLGCYRHDVQPAARGEVQRDLVPVRHRTDDETVRSAA